jgi:pimeloyl-ACP methyl ester carboxylesterase
MERLNQQIRLRDGRKLGFAEYGLQQGIPIFYFHGWPSSRLEPRAVQQACSDLGIRLIAPDRPGFGLSDFQSRRTIPDFTSEVCQLADYLGIQRFTALGVSGGGPYAAACAAKIPERVSLALLVCSVAPADAPNATEGMVTLNRWLLSIAHRAPWLALCIGGICLRALWRKGQQVIPQPIEARLALADKQTLASEELRAALTASASEALRQGVRAAAADGLLLGQPWRFSLQEIRVPVHLWHGEMDVVVPPAMGRYLAGAIPNCRAKFYPQDGHFSLPFTRLREILSPAIP